MVIAAGHPAWSASYLLEKRGSVFKLLSRTASLFSCAAAVDGANVQRPTVSTL